MLRYLQAAAARDDRARGLPVHPEQAIVGRGRVSIKPDARV
jgi:hypothetical protein